jgi:WD40 repeat protein
MEQDKSGQPADFWNTGARRCYVIGAAAYRPPISPLQTPPGDADAVADLLEVSHGYKTHRLTSGTVGLDEILALLERMRAEVGAEDRVVFYFAGHGVPPDMDSSKAGYLLPETASRDDPRTFLSMDDLYARLLELPCRHLLIILDCCFAGSFRWARTQPSRELGGIPERQLYLERFHRFLDRRAWQLLTSAGASELAADILFGQRETGAAHSPFAAALLKGLRGDADSRARGGRIVRDGVITLRKLVDYLTDQMMSVSNRQTVGYYPLENHDDGEYLFLAPGINADSLTLRSVRPVLKKHNPYPGLNVYDFSGKGTKPLYGRDDARRDLLSFVDGNSLTVITGASGTGKSSLMRAGLMRDLAARSDWCVIPPFRPGRTPLANLANALVLAPFPFQGTHLLAQTDIGDVSERLRAWLQGPGKGKRLLLGVDQFEDLLTQAVSEEEETEFCQIIWQAAQVLGVHLVLTIRSDYERRFGPDPGAEHSASPFANSWVLARFPIPAMSDAELREIIRGPANERAVAVEQVVVDLLVREARGQPWRLPLLAATLEQLYDTCIECLDVASPVEWLITEKNYEAVGGVEKGVVNRVERLHLDLSRHGVDFTPTLRRVLLRMVTQEGLRISKRQVPKSEFVFDPETAAGSQENLRVAEVLHRLDTDWLIVTDSRPTRNGENEEVVELIHDAIVQEWTLFTRWIDQSNRSMPLSVRRQLTQEAARWKPTTGNAHKHHSWANSPDLPLAERELDHDPLAFNGAETRFISVSRRQRDVSGRRTKARFALALLTIAMFAAAAVFAFKQAELREAEAESRRLAAEAEMIGSTQPNIAALLSIQATRLQATSQAQAAVLRTAISEPRLLYSLPGQKSHVEHLAFSPDGSLLAAANNSEEQNSGRLVVWDVRSGRVLKIHSYHFRQVMGLAVRPDSRHVAVSFADGTVRLLDLETGQYQDLQPFSKGIDFDSGLMFSSDGQTLLAHNGRQVWGLQIATGKQTIHNLQGYEQETSVKLVVHPGGNLVYAGGRDGRLIRHDLATDSRWQISGRGPAVTAITLDPASGRLAIGRKTGQITVYEPTSNHTIVFRQADGHSVQTLRFAQGKGTLAAELASDESAPKLAIWRAGGVRPVTIDAPRVLYDFALDRDGQYMAVGGIDSYLRVHQTPDGHQFGNPFPGHSQRVYRVAFSPAEPAILATSGDDGMVNLWEITRLSQFSELVTSSTKLPASVEGLAFSPVDDAFAGGGSEGMLFIRPSAQQTSTVWKAPDQNQIFRQIVFSADGHILAAGGESDGLVLLDPRTNRGPQFVPLKGNIKSMAFSNNGATIRTINTSSELRTVRVSDGKPLAEIKLMGEDDTDHASLSVATFRSDGSEVALGYMNGEVLISGLDGRTPRALLKDSKLVSALAYSPDGTTLASAHENIVRLFDVRTEKLLAILLNNHRSSVVALAISSSGKQLAAGCVDGTVLLYDLPSRQQLGTFLAHKDAVFALAFHPREDRLLSGGRDKTAFLWKLDFPNLLRRARGIAGRNLSAAEWEEYVGASTPYQRTFDDFSDGEGVSPDMKHSPYLSGQRIVFACMVAWVPLTLSIPWLAIRQAVGHRIRFYIYLTAMAFLLAGILLPHEIIPGITPLWLDRTLRLVSIGALSILLIWLQRFLDLSPRWAEHSKLSDAP